jgi:hypothetical protein
MVLPFRARGTSAADAVVIARVVAPGRSPGRDQSVTRIRTSSTTGFSGIAAETVLENPARKPQPSRESW